MSVNCFFCTLKVIEISCVFYFTGVKAVSQKCSVKKLFWEITQHTQENTCAKVSSLIKLQATGLLKNRFWHRCFPVNFPKFLRTPFLTEHVRQLLLRHKGTAYIIEAYPGRCQTSMIELFSESRRLKAVKYFCEKLSPINLWEDPKYPQPEITCSNLTIETLEQGMKYVQKRHQNEAICNVLVSLLLTLNIFHDLFYSFYC